MSLNNRIVIFFRKVIANHGAKVESSKLSSSATEHKLEVLATQVNMPISSLLEELTWIPRTHRGLKFDHDFVDGVLRLNVSGPVDKRIKGHLDVAHNYLQERIEKQKKREVE